MEKLNFDGGIQEYALGAGVLRLNPADPNLYVRFQAAAEKITALEERLAADTKALGERCAAEQLLALLHRADREMKALLAQIFPGNDFDAMLYDVNLMAVALNGERVVTNLFAALEHVLTEGARVYAESVAKKK